MKFLANENFPGAAVVALAASGHDTIWIRAAAPAMIDTEILAWADREDRILLTFDKDFGELARKAALPESCGIILFRIPMPAAGEVGERLKALVEARQDWAGHFSVIERGRVRMRKLAA